MTLHIGIVGLGTMAINLGRNLGSKGYELSFLAAASGQPKTEAGEEVVFRTQELQRAKVYQDPATFIKSLSPPRIIFVMVQAGTHTDDVIQSILPHLDQGDVVIDGSNAHFNDTTRRFWELKEKDIHFLGCGFSGGIEEVLNGPAIMPGGSRDGYEIASPVLLDMAAKDADGNPCCNYIGPEGAGHFVKSVHNAIEYVEMQLLAEVYSLLRWAVGLTPEHIAEVLTQWKETDASGYLLDITLRILRHKENDRWVIDSILDSAGHKGTGIWAVHAAAELGIPAMMITGALNARYLSGQRHLRSQLDAVTGIQAKKNVSMGTTDLFNAYQLARVINYQEGFGIIRAVSNARGWNMDLAELSRIWTNGCVIRSAMMERFASLWKNWDEELILHQDIKKTIASVWPGLRRINQIASSETVFTPCLTAASLYLAGATLRFPSANLIQAQRDFFGAHGFWKVDDPSGDLLHFPWKRE